MTEDKDEILSSEETEVKDLFAKYDVRIAEVEAQLDAIKDPQNKPRPAPLHSGKDFTPKDETKSSLQAKIATLEKQAKGRAAEIAEKSQPSIQGKIYERADAWRNEFKEGKEEKTLDESDSFIARLRERGKFARQQKDFDATKEKAGMSFAENKQDATVKPSNYYAHLHFNDLDNPKLPDTDKEIDTSEPDKED